MLNLAESAEDDDDDDGGSDFEPKQLIDRLDAVALEDREDTAAGGVDAEFLSVSSAATPRRDPKREHHRSKSVEDIIQM